MTEAVHNPVKRTYNRREVGTEDMPIDQKPTVGDVSLEDFIKAMRAPVSVDAYKKPFTAEYLAELAFNEEPVTIEVRGAMNTQFPETHVPAFVNGKGIEIFVEGKWIEAKWIPVDIPVTTKRKYFEVLLRSKSDLIKTSHADQAPEGSDFVRNDTLRRTIGNYQVSILQDDNPKGYEWARNIRAQS